MLTIFTVKNCFNRVIHQEDSKNEWLVLVFIFVLTLENTFLKVLY